MSPLLFSPPRQELELPLLSLPRAEGGISPSCLMGIEGGLSGLVRAAYHRSRMLRLARISRESRASFARVSRESRANRSRLRAR